MKMQDLKHPAWDKFVQWYKGEEAEMNLDHCWAAFRAGYADGVDHKSTTAPEQCDIPPTGWKCTRELGHGGPCAAVPNSPTARRRCNHCRGRGQYPPPDGNGDNINCCKCDGTGVERIHKGALEGSSPGLNVAECTVQDILDMKAALEEERVLVKCWRCNDCGYEVHPQNGWNKNSKRCRNGCAVKCSVCNDPDCDNPGGQH